MGQRGGGMVYMYVLEAKFTDGYSFIAFVEAVLVVAEGQEVEA